MNHPPPLPPEPDWAPPPRSVVERTPEAHAAHKAAVRIARQAGGAAFATAALTPLAGALGAGGWTQLVLVVAGVIVTAALVRRAGRAGLPAGELAVTVIVAFVLAGAITIGVVLTVAFGACLIALGSR